MQAHFRIPSIRRPTASLYASTPSFCFLPFLARPFYYHDRILAMVIDHLLRKIQLNSCDPSLVAFHNMPRMPRKESSMLSL
jgi:hypothetical protein